MGKEFYNTDVQRLLKKHDINTIPRIRLKTSVVERFNLALKNDMWKMFTLNGNYKWIGALSRFVADYNARVHRTIAMHLFYIAPSSPAIAEKLLVTVYRAIKIADPTK